MTRKPSRDCWTLKMESSFLCAWIFFGQNTPHWELAKRIFWQVTLASMPHPILGWTTSKIVLGLGTLFDSLAFSGIYVCPQIRSRLCLWSESVCLLNVIAIFRITYSFIEFGFCDDRNTAAVRAFPHWIVWDWRFAHFWPINLFSSICKVEQENVVNCWPEKRKNKDSESTTDLPHHEKNIVRCSQKIPLEFLVVGQMVAGACMDRWNSSSSKTIMFLPLPILVRNWRTLSILNWLLFLQWWNTIWFQCLSCHVACGEKNPTLIWDSSSFPNVSIVLKDFLGLFCVGGQASICDYGGQHFIGRCPDRSVTTTPLAGFPQRCSRRKTQQMMHVCSCSVYNACWQTKKKKKLLRTVLEKDCCNFSEWLRPRAGSSGFCFSEIWHRQLCPVVLCWKCPEAPFVSFVRGNAARFSTVLGNQGENLTISSSQGKKENVVLTRPLWPCDWWAALSLKRCFFPKLEKIVLKSGTLDWLWEWQPCAATSSASQGRFCFAQKPMKKSLSTPHAFGLVSPRDYFIERNVKIFNKRMPGGGIGFGTKEKLFSTEVELVHDKSHQLRRLSLTQAVYK